METVVSDMNQISQHKGQFFTSKSVPRQQTAQAVLKISLWMLNYRFDGSSRIQDPSNTNAQILDAVMGLCEIFPIGDQSVGSSPISMSTSTYTTIIIRLSIVCLRIVFN